MQRLADRPFLVLLALWIFVTAVDLRKPFHIDDTFHLQAAQWIEHHPLHPMSGTINWVDDPEPMHAFNQPPGFFYVIAATGHLFGYTELPMHLMRSLFSMLAIVCFFRIAKFLHPRSALLITALFAVCPPFIAGQGLMTDVPVLALQVLFFRFLLVPGSMTTGWRYGLAGLALSAAVMVKYATLPLLLLFPIVLWERGEVRYLVHALWPLFMLALWSCWNLLDFGGVHLLERGATDPSPTGLYVRGLSLVLCIGAVAPFTFALWKGRSSWSLLVALVAPLLLVGLYIGLGNEWLDQGTVDITLRIVFLVNGAILLYAALKAPQAGERWILKAWVIGLALFLLVFAPGVALRYVLLLLPPVLLLVAPLVEAASHRSQALALMSTAALGALLTVADQHYAQSFRTAAPLIARELKGKAPLLAVGHWGWQWYATKAGMPAYAKHEPVPVGSILVVPDDIAAQAVDSALQCVRIRKWEIAPGPFAFLGVERRASLYTSLYPLLPWSITVPTDRTVRAYRVTGRAPLP